jgi:CubicO group peptidase (beta-lactamase class C family)
MLNEMAGAANAGLQSRIDQALESALARKTIVGAVILVARDGRIAYRRAAGLVDREASRPMREDAIFRLASLTKPIVAAAALAMMDAGKLGLDDPVARWLPDFRPKLADGRTPDILIRHLLTHTAGLAYASGAEDDPYRRAGVSGGLDQPGRGMEDNLRRLALVPLCFEPGTAWRYGMSIDVLGAILAKVEGGSLAEAVLRHVTGPLAMTDTAFSVREPERLAVAYGDGKPEPVRMTEPHVVGDDPETSTLFSPARVFDERSFQSGGAGMAGTASDFMIFLEALRTGGAPVLKSGTLAAATRNQIGDLPREEKDAGWRFGYLSAVLADPAAAKAPHTAGSLQWGGAWGHNWFIDQPAGLSIAAFTNTAMEGCNGKFTIEIRDAVYGQA